MASHLVTLVLLDAFIVHIIVTVQSGFSRRKSLEFLKYSSATAQYYTGSMTFWIWIKSYVSESCSLVNNFVCSQYTTLLRLKTCETNLKSGTHPDKYYSWCVSNSITPSHLILTIFLCILVSLLNWFLLNYSVSWSSFIYYIVNEITGWFYFNLLVLQISVLLINSQSIDTESESDSEIEMWVLLIHEFWIFYLIRFLDSNTLKSTWIVSWKKFVSIQYC